LVNFLPAPTDLDGRLISNDSLPTLPVSLIWDEADRVESITDNGQVQTFGYDALDRLDDAVGDWVLSKHESGEGEREYKRVTQTFKHEDREVMMIVGAGRKLTNRTG